MLHANNKDADQPVHPRSLISVSVIHYLDSVIPIDAKFKISRPWLASVAQQAGLSLTLSHTSEDRFSHDMPDLTFLCIMDSSILAIWMSPLFI